MRKKLLCDSMVTALAISAILLMTVPSIAVSLFLAITQDIKDFDIIWTICTLILTEIVFLGISAYCIPQWFAHIEMDKEGISLNTVYKKTKKEEYDKYPFFTIASYRHIYTTRYFAVIGKRGLNLYEMAHINNVRNSQEIIKINLNKRSYKFLMKVLPKNKKDILQKAFSEGKIIKSETYKKMLERKNKKKKRK